MAQERQEMPACDGFAPLCMTQVTCPSDHNIVGAINARPNEQEERHEP